MSKLLKLMIIAGALAAFVPACTAEKTQEGEMPDVDVQGGQVPKYDVDAADVDVNSTTRTVTVPDVDVTMPNEQASPTPAPQ